jgi:sigma-B regulation protein RsbU (phosphoserine phosphatase)
MAGADPDLSGDRDALYEHAPCGLLLTEADGTIRRANATACQWLGRTRADLAGRRFQDLLTVGGRIFLQTHWSPLLQLQGSVAEVKVEFVGGDGKPVPILMNVVRRDHGGRAMNEIALFVATDRHAYERELLAARRRAEELMAEQQAARDAVTLAEARLRMALEAGHLYVWEADPDGSQPQLDPGASYLLGRGQAVPVDVAHFRAAIVPDDLAHAHSLYAHLKAHPAESHRVSFRARGEDGLVRTVLAMARGVTGQDGRLLRIVGVLQDVSELAAQRAAAEDRALLAEQMVGIVSHDLRNPLSAIALGTEALARPLPDAVRVDVLARMRRSARRAQHLIDDLLDFTLARLGRGLQMTPRPFAPATAIAEHVSELALAHPTRALVMRAEGGGTVQADPARIAQVVDNLVGNAVAYGAPGTEITVGTRVDADRWQLWVHNLGEPIPADRWPTLFEPMVRGTQEGAPRSMGLGLYIVSRIVAAHGGELAVHSDAAEGTRFTATFPVLGPLA